MKQLRGETEYLKRQVAQLVEAEAKRSEARLAMKELGGKIDTLEVSVLIGFAGIETHIDTAG